MDGLTVSIVTLITTIIISYFIACVIKIMVMVLEKIAKPEVAMVINKSAVIESDESEIAAVIAIANSRK
jgi:hypothetical protein